MSSVLTDLRHRHHLPHNMSDETPNRDELASMYFDQLPYEPYPVQEEALLTWFTAKQEHPAESCHATQSVAAHRMCAVDNVFGEVGLGLRGFAAVTVVVDDQAN